jgi:hypothetical protein
MTNSSVTSQVWKGKFSYNPEEYGIVDDVDFELYVELKDGKFEGKVYDDEFRELCDQLAIVKGFIEENRIHFVVTYPISYSMDENDQVQIDPSKKGHDVIYNGFFNPNRGKWEGEWEIMEEEPIEGSDDVYQYHSTGGWEMEKN